MDNIILELKNITKTYGSGETKFDALKNINLIFREGEFVTIIGPSGSGKTTLLNILGALDSPTSGEIIFKNKNISGMNSEELAIFRNEALGFVFQFHHLLPEFSLKENVLIPQWLGSNTTENKDKENEAIEILKFMGLENKINSPVSNLSGGQQQRGAIARALIKKPAIILADEPTGNLDTESSAQILNLLKDINKKYKSCFIIVTHDLSIAKISDRTIKIVDGKIVEDTINSHE